jgi:hypothetical protein
MIKGMEKFYGYNLLKSNPGGFGAAIHDALLASHYAKYNNLKIGIVEGGSGFIRFNGCINDIGGDDKTWHSYFKSLPIIKEKDTVAVWKDCPNGWNISAPGKKIEWYSDLLREIYVLQDDIEKQVEELVIKSGFNPLTDVVLHIRRTDKIFASKGSVIESGELPLDIYVEETMKVMKPGNRVYLCTDDKHIYPEMKDKFNKHNIEILWDNNESELPLQAMFFAGTLKRSDAWEENLHILKSFAIMTRGLYLVGGRMSYFFRIPELLRYPLPSKNIKDNDKFGKAQYAENDDYTVNPFLPKRYLNFVAERPDEEWKKYREILERDYIVTIPNFMNSAASELVMKNVIDIPKNWWMHAIRPDTKNELIYKSGKEKNFKACVEYAEKVAANGNFAYHFERINGNHFKTCVCASCKLVETMGSFEVMNSFSKITGETVTKMEETFVSKYVKDEFLTIHHDKNKGNYTFILSLTKDWNPTYGGLTHFCDKDKNIYKTVTPKFNSLTIFKLSPDHQMDHFVSRVNSTHSRYSYTGWFSVDRPLPLSSNKKILGYSFSKERTGGLGAAVYSLMVALHYARSNNLELRLIEEGRFFPRLNGNINDVKDETKDWHSYFTSSSFVPQKDIHEVWNTYPKDYTTNIPRNVNYKKKIEWFSYLVQKEIFLLRDDIKSEVNSRILKSGFNPATDVVLHIRRTDKIFESKGSAIESGELSLETYIEETVELIKEMKIKARVFLCTDDKSICDQMLSEFAKSNIEMIWDKSEQNLPFQAMWNSGDLKKSDAFEENLVSLTNLLIMTQGLHLVGGRMSYFFQLAELIRYPLPSKNIKDNDKYGKAHYAESDDIIVNPLSFKRYTLFVSEEYMKKSSEEWIGVSNELETKSVVVIPNFINESTGNSIITDLNKYNSSWWGTVPDSKYRFKSTEGKHYNKCVCFSCKLRDTVSSYEFTHILAKIIGRKIQKKIESFAVRYEKDGFLNVNDKFNKGEYTFILSLTNGGSIHFDDKIIPLISNTLLVFKSDSKYSISNTYNLNPLDTYIGWI